MPQSGPAIGGVGESMPTTLPATSAAREGNKSANRFQVVGGLERVGNRPRLNQLASFFSRIEVLPATGCWLWRGSFGSSGYGSFGSASTHRTAYTWFVEPIPDGLELDHLCRVRACCNPAHLEATTKSENQRRAKAVRLICVNGHPWVAANIVIVSSGKGRRSQTCRICHDQRNAESRARVRARAIR